MLDFAITHIYMKSTILTLNDYENKKMGSHHKACVCVCVTPFLFSSKLSALPKHSNSLAVEYNMTNREPSGNKIFVEETQLSQFLR